MVWVIIIATLLGIIGIIGWFICAAKDADTTWTAIGSFSMVCTGIILFISLFSAKEPQAIDVYREKTTLRISYQDSAIHTLYQGRETKRENITSCQGDC